MVSLRHAIALALLRALVPAANSIRDAERARLVAAGCTPPGRSLTTITELNDRQLREGAIFRDVHGDAWLKVGRDWFECAGDDKQFTAEQALRYAPLLVLHEGTPR